MDVGIRIEPMRCEHCDATLVFWQSMEGVELTDSDNPSDLQDYFQRNPGMSHVATRDGRIVGAALCGHDGRRGYLHHLAVALDFRNQGIGRRIVEACLRELTRAGIKRCNLFVFDGNVIARKFWSDDGWAEWPEIRLMQRELR